MHLAGACRYASGMPVLYVTAAASFLFSYWMDKWLFLRFYRTPPMYDEKLGASATRLIPLAVFLHLIVGLWMFIGGRSDTFKPEGTPIFVSPAYSNALTDPLIAKAINGTNSLNDAWLSNVGSKLTQQHALPMFLLALLIVGLWVLESFCGLFNRGLVATCRILTCGKCEKERKKTLKPGYRRAIAGGRLHGLASFNILRNPVYQSAFAVSASFALHHQHVTSVADMKVDAMMSSATIKRAPTPARAKGPPPPVMV